MLLASPRSARVAPFLALFFAAFGLYALAARSVLRRGPSPGSPAPQAAARSGARVRRAGEGAVLAAIVAFAALFRLTLLWSAPVLSDDLYRYRWDGRVLLAGRNPYAEPPAAPSLAPLRDSLYEPIAHKEVRTIYPPAAQLLFAAGAALSTGLLGLKILVALCDLLVILLLRGILARRGLPQDRILLYAWNPLAVIEVAWSGHVEPLGMLFVLAAGAAIIQRRDLRSTLALTIAGLVKILPLALFAPFLRSLRTRAILLAPLVVAAAYWPFRSAGKRLLEGTEEYARRWSANESIFGIAQASIARVDPTPALKGTIAWLRARVPGSGPLDLLYPYLYPPDLARAACAGAALLIALALMRRRIEPLRGSYLMTGALLLLSPTLHPWYLLWILPWLCLFPSRPWILLSGLVALSYVNFGTGGRDAEPCPWIRWPEYLPFYLLLAGEWIAGRRLPGRSGGTRMIDSSRGMAPGRSS